MLVIHKYTYKIIYIHIYMNNYIRSQPKSWVRMSALGGSITFPSSQKTLANSATVQGGFG